MDSTFDRIAIIDNGSGFIKAGFAGYDAPKCIFPTVVNNPINDAEESYIGEEKFSQTDLFTLSRPINRGLIVNWDDIEKIWKHTFKNELLIDPQETSTILTEPPFINNPYREKTVEIMFEKFNVPSLFLQNTAISSLFFSGRTTGFSVESGDGITYCVPIFDGQIIPHAVIKGIVSGRILTDYMAKLIRERGLFLNEDSETEIAKDLKEKCTYISLNYEEDMKIVESSSDLKLNYEMPDGRVIILEKERFQCPEVLFEPFLEGDNDTGLHEKVFDSITKCDIDIRPIIFENVLLSGGSTMFEGIKERLEREVKCLVSPTERVKVIALDDRKYNGWSGISVLASLSSFENCLITKEQYYEEGPRVIRGLYI